MKYKAIEIVVIRIPDDEPTSDDMSMVDAINHINEVIDEAPNGRVRHVVWNQSTGPNLTTILTAVIGEYEERR